MLEIRMESRRVVVSDRLSFALADQRRKLTELVSAGDTGFGGCWFTVKPEGVLIEPQQGISIRIKLQANDRWIESLTKETIFLLRDESTKSFSLEVVDTNAA
jgi:hypothetical protein